MLNRLKGFLKNKQLATCFLVTILMSAMFLIALFSSKGLGNDPGDSGIVDEIAHIPAGYSYDKYLDYRLNPEHPPLAKALAGLPLSLNNSIKGLKDDVSWNAEAFNGAQWEAGWYMLYHSGNNPAKVLLWSRIPMMLLMILLGLFLFKWANELWGRKVGLFVLALYAFYPDVLAHGRLVTTDIAAAFGFVITIYFFDKALVNKTWRSIIIAAVAFGVAQLLKFSAFLLFIALLILVFIRAYVDKKENKKGYWFNVWQNFKPYFWVCVLSLIVVWLVYLPFVWNTPPSIEYKVIESNLTSNPQTLALRNFLHAFENNPFSRALGHYFLGIMLVIGRVEGGNVTFILGQLSEKSISWFFPVAWLLKTSIPIILLFTASVITFFANWGRTKKNLWTWSLILVPFIVYWGVTLKGSLNIGIRHLMPTIPFVLLMIGFTIYPIINNKKSDRFILIKKLVLGFLLIYMIGSTLINYPNFISYFNEATPKDERYKRLVDSSLDWGQDLLRLKKYVDDNNIKSIKVDYFGGSVPSYYIPEGREWHAEYGPTTGWIAVSATFYQSSKLVGPKEGKWSYHWLDAYKPTAQIGGSILVFNITSEDFRNNPPKSPYPIKKVVFPNKNNDRKVGL